MEIFSKNEKKKLNGKQNQHEISKIIAVCVCTVLDELKEGEIKPFFDRI